MSFGHGRTMQASGGPGGRVIDRRRGRGRTGETPCIGRRWVWNRAEYFPPTQKNRITLICRRNAGKQQCHLSGEIWPPSSNRIGPGNQGDEPKRQGVNVGSDFTDSGGHGVSGSVRIGFDIQILYQIRGLRPCLSTIMKFLG